MSANPNLSQSLFTHSSYNKFEKLFREHFFFVNATTKVVNKLEEISYYQGSYIVEKYLDEFQTLIAKASYTNSCIIVVKFCYGL